MARKRGMQYIPYDYEAAYNKAMEDMHEWFIENLFQHRKKVIYALKEITAGDQFEIEIYPQFRSMDEVPPEGRTIKKDNNKAQKNLNDKNARKYVERLINENFSDRDIWMTLTYDDEHLPPDGDVDAAIKNVQKYIRRINYQRKKRGLPNAKYVYVTAYNPDAEIRWHHHIVMDGALDMETVESCWKQSSRNEVRRLQTDENGFPEKMQIYTRCLCEQYDVPYALVLAIIEQESGYEFDKTGDSGQSKGYMQIYEKWHTDRMQNLGCTDLMNPYQNVRVGIDFLSYLLKKYGTIQDTLAAYNYGEKGAREYLWSNGVYVYSYNTAIMQRMKEIEEVVGK